MFYILFFCVKLGNMYKGKAPMDPYTPNETREAPMFDPVTACREVSNSDIWRVRDGESIQDYSERMYIIKTKADRVCYDLELDLNKLYHLSESRRRMEPTWGGVNHQEEPLEEEESIEEEELMEREEPEEEEEPTEEKEPSEEEEPLDE